MHPGLPPAPEERRQLTDRAAALLAAGVAWGAWWAQPLPWWIGASAVGLALVRRNPAVLVVGSFLLACGLGYRAEAGLSPPPSGPFRGVVTLVADPGETPWGVRVDVRSGGKRYEMEASGGAAGTVGRALAGERLFVEGSVRPPPRHAPWLVPRHVVGRLTAADVEIHDAGSAPWRAANRFRRLLQRGSDAMDEPARSLYGGFVLGDDRGQSPEVVDDFRASGLTHLLVVSGSNVAYLLALTSPLTGRLPVWLRWSTTLLVVAAFALLTRFEPSILRASAMAAVAVTASAAGRPSRSMRTLALGIAGLVLVDPLLVRSVGFQLSVAASLGIVVLRRRLAGLLPGPRWLCEPLAVTLSAQLAVAPVLVPRFGGLPVVAVPANLLAGPAAGLVTTWGLPAGVLAGLASPGAARWLHAPTALGISWVASVARASAAVPLGELRGPHLAVVSLGIAAAAAGRARGSRPLGGVGLAAILAALFAPALTLGSPPSEVEPVAGTRVYRLAGATVLVVDRAPTPAAALEGLRLAGVRRIDVLVTADPSDRLLRALRHRWTVTRVVALAQGRGGDQRVVLRFADVTLTITRRDASAGSAQARGGGGPRRPRDGPVRALVVEVVQRPPPGGRAGPR